MSKKFKVSYSGGESRWYPQESVDYMMVNVETEEGDEYELYAEISPRDLADENGIPAVIEDAEDECDCGWNPACPDAEHLSIPYLIKAIREMCEEINVDTAVIDFDGWDSPSEPQYIIPGVKADSRVS